MEVSNTQVIFDNLYGIFTDLAIVVGVIVLIITSFAAVDTLFPNTPPNATWCYGIPAYNQTQVAGQSCPRLDVTGHQFYWVFRYPGDRTYTNFFRVPVDTTIVLDVTSADVFH